MISKNQAKLIQALGSARGRAKHGMFVVEGSKGVQELLRSEFIVSHLYLTEEFSFSDGIDRARVSLISDQEMKTISGLSTPPGAFAIAEIPPVKSFVPGSSAVLALDGVRDPGNLGTILRIADWFGVGQVVCSPDCVDCFNPKVVQASMGSVFRVVPIYMDMMDAIKSARGAGQAVSAAVLGGQSIYEVQFSENAMIVLGSESHGIRPELLGEVTARITIPGFGQAESLNVAVSAALFCSEIRRSIPQS